MRNTLSPSARVFYPRYSRGAVIDLLRARLPELRRQLPLIRAALFGSYASGRQTAASDIDVLLVYAGADRPDAFALAKRALDIRGLEPHVMCEQDFQAVQPVWAAMLQDSVPLM
jgi:predicted nucleotidyltransferase